MQKNKGQISIDLLITLVVAIIVIVSITAFFSNYSANQEKMLLQNQLDMTASKISAFITSSQAMNGTTFTAKMPIEQISYAGERFYPTIAIQSDENKAVISESKSGLNLRTESYYYAPGNFKITSASTELVITNE